MEPCGRANEPWPLQLLEEASHSTSSEHPPLYGGQYAALRLKSVEIDASIPSAW